MEEEDGKNGFKSFKRKEASAGIASKYKLIMRCLFDYIYRFY